MKPLFNLLCAMAMAGCLATPALSASAAGDQIYTWVDKNGVRHFADHPRNPQAEKTLIQPNQTHEKHSKTLAPAAPSAVKPAPAASSVAAGKPQMTPAQRAARCATLKDQVKRLQSARRVQVTKNGKRHFVSGENLVELRAKLKNKMHKMCASPTSS